MAETTEEEREDKKEEEEKAKHSRTECVGGQHSVAYCCVVSMDQQDQNQKRSGYK